MEMAVKGPQIYKERMPQLVAEWIPLFLRTDIPITLQTLTTSLADEMDQPEEEIDVFQHSTETETSLVRTNPRPSLAYEILMDRATRFNFSEAIQTANRNDDMEAIIVKAITQATEEESSGRPTIEVVPGTGLSSFASAEERNAAMQCDVVPGKPDSSSVVPSALVTSNTRIIQDESFGGPSSGTLSVTVLSSSASAEGDAATQCGVVPGKPGSSSEKPSDLGASDKFAAANDLLNDGDLNDPGDAQSFTGGWGDQREEDAMSVDKDDSTSQVRGK